MFEFLIAIQTLTLVHNPLRGEMKQTLFAIGMSLLLFGCGSDQAPSGQSKDTNHPTEGVAEQAEPISASIDEIHDLYAKNQIAAAKKFEGQQIRITGKAVRVREAMGTGFLILRSIGTGLEQEFGFSDTGTALLADVSPGDTVTIICPGVVEGMGMIFIAGCSDLKVK